MVALLPWLKRVSMHSHYEVEGKIPTLDFPNFYEDISRAVSHLTLLCVFQPKESPESSLLA